MKPSPLRKPRPNKPLAVMFRDLEAAPCSAHPRVGQLPRFPSLIVLLRNVPTGLGISPDLAEIGCLLPCSPLHVCC
jgi:hydrogenase maturation protein HypF